MELSDKALKLTKIQRQKLEQLSLSSIENVLEYYPIRYEHYQGGHFDTWKLKEDVFIQGQVATQMKTFRFGQRRSVSKFQVINDQGLFKITIYNRPYSQNLVIGQPIIIFGKYEGKMQITAKSYTTKLEEKHPDVIPIYSIKAGITQRDVKNCIKKVFQATSNEIQDLIPASLKQKYQLLPRFMALQYVHFPSSMHQVALGYRTLKYEEFLRYFVAVQLLKQEQMSFGSKKPKYFQQKDIDQVIQQLPFTLTDGQQMALQDILNDFQQPKIMYRLIQGDVGCGKTIVGLLAMYACYLSGQQSALMCPTEILAKQHYDTAIHLFQHTSVKIAILYSAMNGEEKQRVLDGLKQHTIDMVIGTHSLFQDEVEFAQLGFVVTDEQQRFGVQQRKKIKDKGEQVDFLLMSATPIPRTLAASLFMDLDLSTIETMPLGRQVPITKVIYENKFSSVYQQVLSLLKQGRQLYIICPSVEKNEEFDGRDVISTATMLKPYFKPYTIGYLHGKMKSEEKQMIMEQFAQGIIDILVSTTVIEVGISVGNATGMIIYNADRFGMSQIHQLRGRIQRSHHQGYCWLLTDSQDDLVKQRLSILEQSHDGFEIARQDLRLRGPGDILGTRQSGAPSFVLANFIEDEKMMEQARLDATWIVEHPNELDYQAILHWVYTFNQQNPMYID